MGEGIGSALLGTAGFAAGAAIGQVLIPIPILGGLIGGILGEMFLRKMFSFAKNFLGIFIVYNFKSVIRIKRTTND